MIRKEKKHRPASQVKVAAAATETVTVVAAVPMKGLASELIRLTINRRSSKKRAVCRSRKTGEYLISYTPVVSADNGYLEVFIAAESVDYSTDAISASLSDGTPLKVEKNRIIGLTFEAGKPLKINVKLDFSGDYCSLEVKGYGHTV